MGRAEKKEKKAKKAADDAVQEAKAKALFKKKEGQVGQERQVNEGQVNEGQVDHVNGEEDPLQCLVCQGIMTRPVTLACQHSFCAACIPAVPAVPILVSDDDDNGVDFEALVVAPIPEGQLFCPMCRLLCDRPKSVNISLNKLCQAAKLKAIIVPVVPSTDALPPAPPGNKTQPKETRGPKRVPSMVPANMTIGGRVRAKNGKRVR